MTDNPDPETTAWKRESAKFDAAGPVRTGYSVVAIPVQTVDNDGRLFPTQHDAWELRGPAGDVIAVAIGEDGRSRLTKRAAELNAAAPGVADVT